jgi:20S proteasome subunit alpha 5
LQVEYAIEAIKLGSTAIGISTSEGIVLAVEKRITSSLMEPSTIKKIVEVDRHIGCAVSGLIADSRTLIDRARVEAQHHWFTYNEKMSVESVAQAVSNLAIQFGDTDDDSGSSMVSSQNSIFTKFKLICDYASEPSVWSCYVVCWM